jgi:hypothetical protein
MDGTWEAGNIAAAFCNSCYIVAPNFGPYYTTSGSRHPYDVSGGNSMIVDYLGRLVRRTKTTNAAIVPGDIDITKLRHWRASGMTFGVQVRSGLWKQIYEQWPDYPKNLYLEHDVPKAAERAKIKQQIVDTHVKEGLITPPEK